MTDRRSAPSQRRGRMDPRELVLGRVTGYAEVGGMTVVRSTYRSVSRVARHTHDGGPTLAMSLRGSYREEVEGRVFEVAGGAVLIKPPGAWHANTYPAPGAACVVISLPLATADDVFERPELLHMPASAPLHLQLSRELDLSDDLSDEAIEAIVSQILVGVRRAERRSAGGEPPWLVAAERLLAEGARHGVRVRDVAKSLGITPARLGTVFRTHRETTPTQVIRAERVRWARGELVHSDRPIAQVAIEAGFSDQAHLTRVFRRTLGTTPGRIRREGRRRPENRSN